jgi:hypothetical protein
MGDTAQKRAGKSRDLRPRRRFALLPSLLPLLLPLLLGACGSVLTAIEDPPMKPGMAQLIIYRIGNSPLVPANAIVEVNGERIASLGPRERQTADLKPGHTVVSITSSLLPIGRYTVEFEAAAEQKYSLSVALRGDTIVQPLPGSYKITETPGTAFQIGQGH